MAQAKELAEPNAVRHCNHLMYMYQRERYRLPVLETKSATQALRDALHSAKMCHLISDYNLETGELTWPNGEKST